MSGRRSKNQRLGSSRRPKGLSRNIEKDDDEFQQVAESGQNEFHTTTDHHSAQSDHPPSSTNDQQTSVLECPPQESSYKDLLMETEMPERKRKIGSTRKSAGGFQVERKHEVRTTKELDEEYVTQPNTSATEEQSGLSSFPSNLSLQTESFGLEMESGPVPMVVVSEDKVQHETTSSQSYEANETMEQFVHSSDVTVAQIDLLQEDSVMFDKLKSLSRHESPLANTSGQKRRVGSTRRPLGGKNSGNGGVQEHSRSMTENERKAEVTHEEEMAQTWDDVAKDAPSSHTESALRSNQSLLVERADLKDPDVSAGTETMNQSVAFPLVGPEKPLPKISSQHGTPLLNEGMDFMFDSHTENFAVPNIFNKAGSQLSDNNRCVPDKRNGRSASYDSRDVNTEEAKPSKTDRMSSLSQSQNAELNNEKSLLLGQHDSATDNNCDLSTAQLIVGGSRGFDVPPSNISLAKPTMTRSPHEMSDAVEEMKQENNVCDADTVACDADTVACNADVDCIIEDDNPEMLVMRRHENVSETIGSETDNALTDQSDLNIMDVKDNDESRETSTETEKEELQKEQDDAGKMLENKEVGGDIEETDNTATSDVTSKSEEMFSFVDSAANTGSYTHQVLIQSPDKQGYGFGESVHEESEKEEILFSTESENAALDIGDSRSKETEGTEEMDTAPVECKPQTSINSEYNDDNSDMQTENPENRDLKEEEIYTSTDASLNVLQVSENVSTVIDCGLHLQNVTIGSEVTYIVDNDAEMWPAGGDKDLEIQTQNKTDTSISKAEGTEVNLHDASVEVKIHQNTVETNMTSEKPENEVSNDLTTITEDIHTVGTHSESTPVVHKRKMGSTRRPLKGNKGQRKGRENQDEFETLKNEVVIHVETEMSSLANEPSPDESTFRSLKDGGKEQTKQTGEEDDVGLVERSESAILQSLCSSDLLSEESTAVSVCHITESQTLLESHEESQESVRDAERLTVEGGTDLQLKTESENKTSDLASEAEVTEDNIHDLSVLVRDVELTGNTVIVKDMSNESDLLQNDTLADEKLKALKVPEHAENVFTLTESGFLVQDDPIEGSGETNTIPEQGDINITPEDTHREEAHSEMSPVVHKRKMGSTRRPLKGNKGQRKGREPGDKNETSDSTIMLKVEKETFILEDEPSPDKSILKSSNDEEKEQEIEICKNYVGFVEGSKSAFLQSSCSSAVVSEESNAVIVCHFTESQPPMEIHKESWENTGDAEKVLVVEDTDLQLQTESKNQTSDSTSKDEGLEENIYDASDLAREFKSIPDTVENNMTTEPDLLQNNTLADGKQKSLSVPDSTKDISTVTESGLLVQDDPPEGSGETNTIPEQSHISITPDDTHSTQHNLDKSALQISKDGAEEQKICEKKDASLVEGSKSALIQPCSSYFESEESTAANVCHITESETHTEIHEESQDIACFVKSITEVEEVGLHLETQNKTFNSSVEETEQNVPDAVLVGEVEVIRDTVTEESNMSTESNAEKYILGDTDTILDQSEINISEDIHREEDHLKLGPASRRKMGSTRRPLRGNKGQRREKEDYDEINHDRKEIILEDAPSPAEHRDNPMSIFDISVPQTISKLHGVSQENCEDVETVPGDGETESNSEIQIENKTTDSTTSEAKVTEETICETSVLVKEVELIGDKITLENMTSESDSLQNATSPVAKPEALQVSDDAELKVLEEKDTIPMKSDTNIFPKDEEVHSKLSPVVHKRKMGSTRRPLKGSEGSKKGIENPDENETHESEGMINVEKETMDLEDKSNLDESLLQSSKDGIKEQETEICEMKDVGLDERCESSSCSSDVVSEEPTAVIAFHITESQTRMNIHKESQENTGDAEKVVVVEDTDLQLQTESQNQTSDSTSKDEEPEENICDVSDLEREFKSNPDTVTVENNITTEPDLLQNDTLADGKLESLNIPDNAEDVSTVTESGLLVLDDPIERSGETNTIPEQSHIGITPEDTHREEAHSDISPVVHRRKMGSTRRPLKGNKGLRKGREHENENETLDNGGMINVNEQILDKSTLEISQDGAEEQEICETKDVGLVEESKSALLQPCSSDLESEESTAANVCHITESETHTEIHEESQDIACFVKRMTEVENVDLHIETQNKTFDSSIDAEGTEQNVPDAVLVGEVEVIIDIVTEDSNMTTESNAEKDISGDADTILDQSEINISEDIHREEGHLKLGPVSRRKIVSTQRPLRGNKGQRRENKEFDEINNERNKFFLEDAPSPAESRDNVMSICDISESQTISKHHGESQENCEDVEIVPGVGETESHSEIQIENKTTDSTTSEAEETEETICETSALVKEVELIGDKITLENMTSESDLLQNATSPVAKPESLQVSDDDELKVLEEKDTIPMKSDTNIFPKDEEVHSKLSPVVHKRKMGSTRRPLKESKVNKKGRENPDDHETHESEGLINVEKQTMNLEDEPNLDESVLQSLKDGINEQETEKYEKKDFGRDERCESSSCSSDVVSEESTAVIAFHITESQTLMNIHKESQENTGDAEKVVVVEDTDLQLQTESQNQTSDSTSKDEEPEEYICDVSDLEREFKSNPDTVTVENNLTTEPDLLQNDTLADGKLELLNIPDNAEDVSTVTESGLLVQDDPIERSGETNTIPEQSHISITPEDTHREEAHSDIIPVVHRRKMGSTRRPLKGNKGLRKEREHEDENETLDNRGMINVKEETIGLEYEQILHKSILLISKDEAEEQEICEKNDVGLVEGSKSALIQPCSSDFESEESTAANVCHITESETHTEIHEESQDIACFVKRMTEVEGVDLHLETQNKTFDSSVDAEGTEQNVPDAVLVEVEVIRDTVTEESNMATESNAEKNISGGTDIILDQHKINIPEDIQREEGHLNLGPVSRKKMGSTRRPLRGNKGQRREKEDYDEIIHDRKEIISEDAPRPAQSRDNAMSICDISESQTISKLHGESQKNCEDVETVPGDGETESNSEIQIENKTTDSTTSEAKVTEETICETSVLVKDVELIGDEITLENMTSESDSLQNATSPVAKPESLQVSDDAELKVPEEEDTIPMQSDTNIIPKDEEVHLKLSPVVHKRKMGSTRRPLKGSKGIENPGENETHESKRMINVEKETMVLEDKPNLDEPMLQSLKDGIKEQETKICEMKDVGLVERHEASSCSSDVVSEESTAVIASHIDESQTLTKIHDESQENTEDAEKVVVVEDTDLQLQTESQNQTSDSTSKDEGPEENIYDTSDLGREFKSIPDTVTVKNNMNTETDLFQIDTLKSLNIPDNTEDVSTVTESGLLVEDDPIEVSEETNTIPEQSHISITPEDTHREEAHIDISPVVHKRKMGSTRRPLKGNKSLRKGREHENETLDNGGMINVKEETIGLEYEQILDKTTLQISKDGAEEQEICETKDVGLVEESKSALIQQCSSDLESEESTAANVCHITESETHKEIHEESQDIACFVKPMTKVEDVDLHLETQNKTFVSLINAEEKEQNVLDAVLVGEVEVIRDTVTEESNMTTESNAEKDISGDTDTILDQSEISIPEDIHREDRHLKLGPASRRKMGSTRRPLRGNKGQRREKEDCDEINHDRKEMISEDAPRPAESRDDSMSICDISESQTISKCHEDEKCEDVETVPGYGETESNSEIQIENKTTDSTTSEAEETEETICETSVLVKDELIRDKITLENMTSDSDSEQNATSPGAKPEALQISEDAEPETPEGKYTIAMQSDTNIISEDNEREVHSKLSPVVHKRKMGSTRRPLKGSEGSKKGIENPDENETHESEGMINVEKETMDLEDKSNLDESVLQSSKDGIKEQENEICEMKDVGLFETRESSSCSSDVVSEESTAVIAFHITESQTLMKIHEESQKNTGDAEKVVVVEDTDLQLQTVSQNQTSDSTSKDERSEENICDVSDFEREFKSNPDMVTVENNMTTEPDLLQNDTLADGKLELLNIPDSAEDVSTVTESGLLVQDDPIEESGETNTIPEQSYISITPEDTHREEAHSDISPVVHRRKMGSTRRPLKGNKEKRKGRIHEDENETLDNGGMINVKEETIGFVYEQNLDKSRLQMSKDGAKEQEICETKDVGPVEDPKSALIQPCSSDLESEESTAANICHITESETHIEIHKESQDIACFVKTMTEVENVDLHLGTQNKTFDSSVDAEGTEQNVPDAVLVGEVEVIRDTVIEESNQTTESNAEKDISGDADTILDQSEISIPKDIHREDGHLKLGPVSRKKMGSTRRTLRGNKGQRREKEDYDEINHDRKEFISEDAPSPVESRDNAMSICDISESQTISKLHGESQENCEDVETVPGDGETEPHSEIQIENKTTDSTTSEAKVTEETICETSVLVKDVELIGDKITLENMTSESDSLQNATSPVAKPESLQVSDDAELKVPQEKDTIPKQSDTNTQVHSKLSPVVHKRKMGSTRRPLKGNNGQQKVRESKVKDADNEAVSEEEGTDTHSEIQDQAEMVDHNVTQEIMIIRDNTYESEQKQFNALAQDQRSNASQTHTVLSHDDTSLHLLEVSERKADFVRDNHACTSHTDQFLSDTLLITHAQNQDVILGDSGVPPTEEAEMHSVSKTSLQKRKIGSTRKRGKRMVNEEEIDKKTEGESENTTTDDRDRTVEEKSTIEEAITGSPVHEQLFKLSAVEEDHDIQNTVNKLDVQTEFSEQNDPNSTTNAKLLIESECLSNASARMVSDLALCYDETLVPKQSVTSEESHREDQTNLNPVVQKRKMGSTRKTLRGNKGQRREEQSKKMESEGMTQEHEIDLASDERKGECKFDEEVKQNPVEFSHPATTELEDRTEVPLNLHDLSEASEETRMVNTGNGNSSLNEAIHLCEGTRDKFMLAVPHEDVHQTIDNLDQHVHVGSEPEQTEYSYHGIPTNELQNTQEDACNKNSSQKIPATQEIRRKMGSTRRNQRVMYENNMAEDRETKKPEDKMHYMSPTSSMAESNKMPSEDVSTTDIESGILDLKADPCRPTGNETPENTLQIRPLEADDDPQHLQTEVVTGERRRKMGSTRRNFRRIQEKGDEDTKTADIIVQSQDSEMSLEEKAVGEQPVNYSNLSEDSLLSEIEQALNKTSLHYQLNSGDSANATDIKSPENSEINSLQPTPSQNSKTHSQPNSPERRRRKMGSTRKNPKQQLKAEREDEDKVVEETNRNLETNKQKTNNIEKVEVSVVQNITETQLNKEYLDVLSAHTSGQQEESAITAVREKASPSTKRKFGSRRANKDKQGLGRLDASDNMNQFEDGDHKPDEDNRHVDDLVSCDPHLSSQTENQPTSQLISEESSMDARNMEKAASKGTGAGLVSLDQIIKHDRKTEARQTVNLKSRISDTEVVQFNVVMVGNSCVGKTSFIRRLHEGQFSEDYRSTIGVDTFIQTVALPDRTVRLQIWDTAGQERFHSITKQLFHKADGLLLMYDITCSKSFLSVRDWISQARERAPDDVIMMLLGNKNDSVKPEVQLQEGEDLAREYNMHFMECSAATGANVSESMRTLAELLMQRGKQKQEHTILRREQPQKKSGCC